MDIRNELHTAVDTHIEQLMVSYFNIIQMSSIETVEGLPRKSFMDNFQIKLHLHGLLHSCRSIIQLAADVSVIELTSNIPRLEEQQKFKEEVDRKINEIQQKLLQLDSKCYSKTNIRSTS